MDSYGCFPKWWYPQIIHFNRVFHYKPSILGYHYFWKHPYGFYGSNNNQGFFRSPGPWWIASLMYRMSNSPCRVPSKMLHANWQCSPRDIPSMYGIFAYIYHKQKPSNVGEYTIQTIHGWYGNENKSKSHELWQDSLFATLPFRMGQVYQVRP